MGLDLYGKPIYSEKIKENLFKFSNKEFEVKFRIF